MRYETAFDASGRNFTWSVARHGYSLIERTREFTVADAIDAGVPVRKQSGLAFVSNAPPPPDTCKTRADIEAWRGEHVIDYAPADRGDLHRAFVRIRSHDNDAARAFVNGYGLITHGPHPAFVADFFAGQELIRDVMQLGKRSRISDGKAEEVINRNRSSFFLRVAFPPAGKLVQQLVPNSLLGWMLLQALRELSGLTWGECEVCRAPFEVRDERAANKKFCSERCRQKNFREKGRF